jgi:uncharacterized membrane protein
MVFVLLLLVIESPRYRFFDVYRARVRLLERQYFARVFAAGGESDAGMRALSDDLQRPVFLMSRGLAFSRRVRRNYIARGALDHWEISEAAAKRARCEAWWRSRRSITA